MRCEGGWGAREEVVQIAICEILNWDNTVVGKIVVISLAKVEYVTVRQRGSVCLSLRGCHDNLSKCTKSLCHCYFPNKGFVFYSTDVE